MAMDSAGGCWPGVRAGLAAAEREAMKTAGKTIEIVRIRIKRHRCVIRASGYYE